MPQPILVSTAGVGAAATSWLCPEDVALHNRVGDLWVVLGGRALDLSQLSLEASRSAAGRALLAPLLLHGGSDVSHWFEPETDWAPAREPAPPDEAAGAAAAAPPLLPRLQPKARRVGARRAPSAPPDGRFLHVPPDWPSTAGERRSPLASSNQRVSIGASG